MKASLYNHTRCGPHAMNIGCVAASMRLATVFNWRGREEIGPIGLEAQSKPRTRAAISPFRPANESAAADGVSPRTGLPTNFRAKSGTIRIVHLQILPASRPRTQLSWDAGSRE